MTLLTPEDIRRMPLTVTRWREGYDADEVDDLLDECAESVRRVGLWALMANSRANAYRSNHRRRRRALKRSRKSIKGKGLGK